MENNSTPNQNPLGSQATTNQPPTPMQTTTQPTQPQPAAAQPIQATPPVPPQTSATPGAMPNFAPVSAPSTAKNNKKLLWLIIAIAGAALVVVIIVVLFILFRTQTISCTMVDESSYGTETRTMEIAYGDKQVKSVKATSTIEVDEDYLEYIDMSEAVESIQDEFDNAEEDGATVSVEQVGSNQIKVTISANTNSGLDYFFYTDDNGLATYDSIEELIEDIEDSAGDDSICEVK